MITQRPVTGSLRNSGNGLPVPSPELMGIGYCIKGAAQEGGWIVSFAMARAGVECSGGAPRTRSLADDRLLLFDHRLDYCLRKDARDLFACDLALGRRGWGHIAEQAAHIFSATFLGAEVNRERLDSEFFIPRGRESDLPACGCYSNVLSGAAQ
jgi:hypothetical protein